MVVIAVLEFFLDLEDHLEIVSSLYDYFKLHNVKKTYEGSSLRKPITTCWSGHYFAVNVIEKNKEKIIETLEKCSTWRAINGSQRTTASALKHHADDPKFTHINAMLDEALGLIDKEIKHVSLQ